MSCRVVAAFDFGTTYSGYAFSYYDFPMAVRSNQSWTAAPDNIVSLKTSTCLLLDPNGQMETFGYEAEDRYRELANTGEQSGWRLFRQFKMMLHNNKTLSPSTTVDDVNGEPMQALKVFAYSIQYLHQLVLESVKAFIDTMKGVEFRDVRMEYVITVPAIWDDRARQFMREAGSLAGIEASRLRLVLEPEAASCWGQSVKAEALALSVTGAQYMVIDLGGGTADISVHEKLPNGTLREVHQSTGGPWGGKYVDQGFLKLLNNIFGPKAIERLKDERIGEYLKLLSDFEVQKCEVSPEFEEQLEIPVPDFLFDVAKEAGNDVRKGDDGPDGKSETGIAGVEINAADKLILVGSNIVKAWFDVPLDNLIEHVNKLLELPKLQNIQTVLLVGGFGESKYAQEKLKRCIKTDRLVVPENAGMIVLVGAVRCGHIPNLVSSKVQRHRNLEKHKALFDNFKTQEVKKS